MDLIGCMIHEICHTIKSSKPVGWKPVSLDNEDHAIMKEEFGSGQDARESPFDPMRIRQRAWKDWKEGKIDCSAFECKYGRIVSLFPSKKFDANDIPFTLWSQILGSFAPKGRYIRVYLVASDNPRYIPEKGGIGPEHINGGYCYPCRKNLAVFVFRSEDATRVLIHELLHAFCTDRFDVGLDLIEARTEAWAEIIWCCFMAGGDRQLARQFIEQQMIWVINQNRAVTDYIGVDAAVRREFPWRYTLGKDSIFRRWFSPARLPEPVPDKNPQQSPSQISIKSGKSLRLTDPVIAMKGSKITKEPIALI